MEDAQVVELAREDPPLTDAQIAKRLGSGRTVHSVRARRRYLNETRTKGAGVRQQWRKWTPEEDGRLRELLALGKRAADIADAMDRTRSSVENRIFALRRPEKVRANRDRWNNRQRKKTKEYELPKPKPEKEPKPTHDPEAAKARYEGHVRAQNKRVNEAMRAAREAAGL